MTAAQQTALDEITAIMRDHFDASVFCFRETRTTTPAYAT